MSIPSKAKIFEHWMYWLDQNGFDWVEPKCWSCGKYWGDRYDIKDVNTTREEIIRNWNRVPLQRCHIVPRQFGGSDDVDNLFLMCRECHDRGPNTSSREMFLLWVSKQSFDSDLNEMIKKELKIFDLENKTERINNLLKNKNLIGNIKGNIGIHFNQSRGGANITISTLVAAIAEYIRQEESLENKE